MYYNHHDWLFSKPRRWCRRFWGRETTVALVKEMILAPEWEEAWMWVCGSKIRSGLSCLWNKSKFKNKNNFCFPLRSLCQDTQSVWSSGAMERWLRKYRMMLEFGYSSNKVGSCDDFHDHGCIYNKYLFCSTCRFSVSRQHERLLSDATDEGKGTHGPSTFFVF